MIIKVGGLEPLGPIGVYAYEDIGTLYLVLNSWGNLERAGAKVLLSDCQIQYNRIWMRNQSRVKILGL